MKADKDVWVRFLLWIDYEELRGQNVYMPDRPRAIKQQLPTYLSSVKSTHAHFAIESMYIDFPCLLFTLLIADDKPRNSKIVFKSMQTVYHGSGIALMGCCR
jgi:hypothetical protein